MPKLKLEKKNVLRTFTIYAVQELNLPNSLLFYKQVQSIQFNFKH